MYIHLGMACGVIMRMRLAHIKTLRNAVDADVLETAQRMVLEGGTHDCGEWRHGLRCGVCGTVL